MYPCNNALVSALFVIAIAIFSLLLRCYNMISFKRFYTLYIIIALVQSVYAQERTVENRPYCDLRPLHFGVIVGTHFQGLEFENVGTQRFTDENGNVVESLVTCEQDRSDNGFHVGVLGELRLSEFLAFRVAPTMYFGNRHITFHDLTAKDDGTTEVYERQNLKTAYVACSMDLIYAAKRFNNHRPYVMMGISPMLNLSAKSSDYIRLKSTDLFFEVGMGCDFYLPFFKLRPELKFMYSLGNCLKKGYVNQLKDKNLIKYAGSISSAKSSIIALTFYFE